VINCPVFAAELATPSLHYLQTWCTYILFFKKGRERETKKKEKKMVIYG